jgi:hypothetical protein
MTEVDDPWVVVTMGSGDCGPNNCPGGVDGPYPGHAAARAAAARIPAGLRPHTLPLTPPVGPLFDGQPPEGGR